MASPFAVRADAGVDDVDVGGQFSLSSPHGAATWLAIISLVIIALLVGRGRGILGSIMAALVFIGLVGAAQIAFGHLAHSWVASHPESPIAVGLEFDLSGV